MLYEPTRSAIRDKVDYILHHRYFTNSADETAHQIVKMHRNSCSSNQELTFDSIDIKRIFEPFEQSLDIIKEFIGNDTDAAEIGGEGLVKASDSVIKVEPHEKRNFAADNFNADTFSCERYRTVPNKLIGVKEHTKKNPVTLGTQSHVDKISDLQPVTRALNSSEENISNCHLPLLSTKRCIEENLHLSRKVARVQKEKWVQEFSFSGSQNCNRTTPIQLKNELYESHKPISTFHGSVKDDKCPQIPTNNICLESDKPVANILSKVRSPDEKRDTVTGQNFEDIILSLYQAMKKSKCSHQLLNEWDKEMGLKKCHSKTMSRSDQSRNHLMWSIFSSGKGDHYSKRVMS